MLISEVFAIIFKKKQIKDQEAKWFLFNDDRTEFLMELSDMIFEQLVEEMAAEQID